MRAWLLAPFAMAAAGALSSQIIVPGSLDRAAPLATIPAVPGGGAGTAALALAAARDIGEVNFVSLAPMAISLKPDLTASTYAVITSKAPLPAVSFYIVLKRMPGHSPCAGGVTTLTGGTAIDKNVSVYVPIEITGCAAGTTEGVLGIMGSSGARHERAIVLTRSESPLLRWCVLASLLAAVVLVVAVVVVMLGYGHKPGDPIGDTTWDLSASWVSNVTAFGAAFAFLAQLSVFPAKPSVGSRSEYMFLTAFALALTALAPVVQRAVGPAITGPAAPKHGMVGGFLLACAFTLWGAFLQAGTQLLVLHELSSSVTVSPTAIRAAFVLIVVGCAGLAIYGIRSMLLTIAQNGAKTDTPAGGASRNLFQTPSPQLADALSHTIPVL